MLAVVKMPHTEFKIEGDIPEKVIKFFKSEYGDRFTINEDEALVNVVESEWYKAMETNDHPGISVRVYRNNKGWTQTQLGKKLGNFSRQYISDIENARKGISKAMAKKLSQFFKVPIDRFL